MSIPVFPITPNANNWGIEANGQDMRSDLNKATQTVALPGDMWTDVLTFTNVIGTKARILRAFLASLRGVSGRFYLPVFGYARAGAGGGSPLVNGANQTGATLTIDGCAHSVTGWLLAGDYFQAGNELKMLTADANTDSNGQTTLTFVPPIRIAPADNSAVIINNPMCFMKLKDNNQAKWPQQPGKIYVMSVAVEEALDI